MFENRKMSHGGGGGSEKRQKVSRIIWMAPKEKDHRFHIIASEKTKFKMLSYCVNFLKRHSNFFRRNFLRRQRRNRVSTLQRSEEDLLMEKFDEILFTFSKAGVLNLLFCKICKIYNYIGLKFYSKLIKMAVQAWRHAKEKLILQWKPLNVITG